MFKIIPRDSTPVSVAAVSVQGYTLVRTARKTPWSSMILPLTIGSSTDSDIVVNAPTMRAVSRVAAIDNGALVLIDAQTGAVTGLNDLGLFGIEMCGPFSADPLQMPAWRRALRLGLIRERDMYQQRFPALFRRILPREQAPRLVSLALLVTSVIAAAIFSPETTEVIPDLSQRPVAAHYGDIAPLGITSTGKKSPYAKGATIAFGPTESSQTKQYVITVNVTGLQHASELGFEFNGKFLGATTPMLGCIDAYCTLEYPVAAEFLRAEGNSLRVIHNSPESSYGLRSVYFRSMEPATAEELERAQQLIASADRYYDERFLITQNIRSAQDSIDEVDRMLSTRTGMDNLKPKFALTKDRVGKAFQEISSDLRFRLEKEFKLNHRKPALDLANELLKLYPDAASKEYNFLMGIKKRLEGASK